MTNEELWEFLGRQRVVIWFCPKEHPREGRPMPSVEWERHEDGRMTPHCLVCGEVGATR